MGHSGISGERDGSDGRRIFRVSWRTGVCVFEELWFALAHCFLCFRFNFRYARSPARARFKSEVADAHF